MEPMLVRHRPAVFLVLSLAAALVLTSVVADAGATHEPPGMAAASGNLPQVRRSVVWYGVPEATPRSLHIESSSVGASAPDEFQISYADGNFTLVYQRIAGGPITSHYTLSIRGLVEWNDTQGDGHIEDGLLVAYTPLGAGGFGRYPIQHSNWTTSGGVVVDSFLIFSNKGDVSLNLTIANGFVSLPSGKILTPMEAKLGVDIQHNLTAAGSRLSLQIGVTTDQKVVLENQSWDDQNDFSVGDRALNVTNADSAAPSSAFFAWSNIASVNGQEGAVIPSGPTVNQTTGDYDLYLSYPKAAANVVQLRISHDPTLGVVSVAYESILNPGPGSPLPFVADPLIYVLSLAAIAVLVLVTAILVRRRGPKAP